MRVVTSKHCRPPTVNPRRRRPARRLVHPNSRFVKGARPLAPLIFVPAEAVAFLHSRPRRPPRARPAAASGPEGLRLSGARPVGSRAVHQRVAPLLHGRRHAGAGLAEAPPRPCRLATRARHTLAAVLACLDARQHGRVCVGRACPQNKEVGVEAEGGRGMRLCCGHHSCEADNLFRLCGG